MKKIILIVLSVIWAVGISAQVTIGSDKETDPSAILELKTPLDDKGFLGPKVKLISRKQATPVTNPATGLLVFNTDDSPANIPDDEKVFANKFYYWENGEWVSFIGKNEIETIIKGSLDELGIPRSVIYHVNPAQTEIYSANGTSVNVIKDFLYNYSPGTLKDIPLVEAINFLENDVTLSGNNTLRFKPGVYSITFSYDFTPTSNTIDCTLSSYFVDFPINPSVTGDRARIHSNTAHGTKLNSGHSNSIRYVAKFDSEINWRVRLGVGQSGSCTQSTGKVPPGLALVANGTFIQITKIGNQ